MFLHYEEPRQDVHLVLRPAETVCHPRDGEKPASGVTHQMPRVQDSALRACEEPTARFRLRRSECPLIRSNALPLGVRCCPTVSTVGA